MSWAQNWTNGKVETEMETVLASVKCLRALRAELLEKQKNERSDKNPFFFWKEHFETIFFSNKTNGILSLSFLSGYLRLLCVKTT